MGLVWLFAFIFIDLFGFFAYLHGLVLVFAFKYMDVLGGSPLSLWTCLGVRLYYVPSTWRVGDILFLVWIPSASASTLASALALCSVFHFRALSSEPVDGF